MPDVHGDRATYDQHVEWTARKATSLSRHILDCGHPNPGEVFYHAWCDRLSCSEACANAKHECGEYAGVRSSIEEESEPVNAVVAQLEVLGDYLEALPQGDTSQVPFDTLCLTTDRGYASRLWAEDWNSPEDAAYDEPNGIAPTDPVADAMRAEVLRQGLTECEIDGVPWVYRDGQWRVARPLDVAEVLRLGVAELANAMPALGAAATEALADLEKHDVRPWWRRIWSRTPPTGGCRL